MNKDIANLIIEESKKPVPLGLTHDFQLPGFDQNEVEQTVYYLIGTGEINAALFRYYEESWTIRFENVL